MPTYVYPWPSLAAFLLIVGGAAQIGGVSMVIVSLNGALKSLERYKTRSITIYGAGAFEIDVPFGGVTVVTPPPPLETRVTALEERVVAIGNEIKEESVRMRGQVREEIKHSHESVAKTMGHEIDKLSKFTTESLKGQRWPTIIGALLIIVGVVLATIGSLVA